LILFVCFFRLSDDYSKLAILEGDRTLEFHNQGFEFSDSYVIVYGRGYHYKLKLPRVGRDLCYLQYNCDLVVGLVFFTFLPLLFFSASSSPFLYRINLSQGRFMEPLSLDPFLSTSNVVKVSQIHPLLVTGIVQ
jgi:ribosome biogenesis protein ENP2